MLIHTPGVEGIKCSPHQTSPQYLHIACHEAEDKAGHLHFGHHGGGDWVGCTAKVVSTIG